MPSPANPNLHEVDWSRIPAPTDDGGAKHLAGLEIPDVALPATDGSSVSLAQLAGRVIVFAYPRTGEPGKPSLVDDWDMIPGARGCTPQSCAFRDLHKVLIEAGAARVFGLSTQDTAYQRAAVDRLHLPFPLLSDEKLALTRALRLPTMEVGGLDAHQAAGARHRRWRNHQGLLSRVPARPECGRRARLARGASAPMSPLPAAALTDDGAVRHLRRGKRLPDVALPTTGGREVSLARLPGRTIVYCYPWTGRPGQPNPPGWDDIPGAHGSTPQTEGFRDLYVGFRQVGAEVFGLSTQPTSYQRELVERLAVPFEIISDERLRTAAGPRPADVRHRRRHVSEADDARHQGRPDRACVLPDRGAQGARARGVRLARHDPPLFIAGQRTSRERSPEEGAAPATRPARSCRRRISTWPPREAAVPGLWDQPGVATGHRRRRPAR